MKIKFYRKVLENGMTVLLEKRDNPIVSVAIAIRRGGAYEEEHEKGISHFIEHLLYKGTKNRTSKQIAEEIESLGGDINGFTDQLLTVYWCKLPSKHLKVALDVLSDMVKNPLFNDEDIEKERKIIFEEIKMRRDSPGIYVRDKIHNLLYKKPFGADLIGTYKSMSSITREQIIRRFRDFYVPRNMILGVVGNANFGQLINFAKKNFKSDSIKKIKKISEPKIILRNKTCIEKRKGLDQANLVLSYHVPLSGNKKSYAAYILNVLTTGGMSSRLFFEIREKRNLAYAIKGDSEITKYFGYNSIYVGTKKEKVGEIKKIILKEFEKIAKSLDKKEFKKIKEQIIGNYQISIEDSQTQLTNLLMYEIDGNAKEFYNFEKNIKSVKLKDVRDLAETARKKYSFFVLLPS
ncbi:MAG: pitrilysin family protein [Candidatus Pacearchaeota archaeon]